MLFHVHYPHVHRVINPFTVLHPFEMVALWPASQQPSAFQNDPKRQYYDRVICGVTRYPTYIYTGYITYIYMWDLNYVSYTTWDAPQVPLIFLSGCFPMSTSWAALFTVKEFTCSNLVMSDQFKHRRYPQKTQKVSQLGPAITVNRINCPTCPSHP